MLVHLLILYCYAGLIGAACVGLGSKARIEIPGILANEASPNVRATAAYQPACHSLIPRTEIVHRGKLEAKVA
jgi:hypothetical protein